jgi:lipoprotein-anchoring transpeptidase ErfK/SrfK
MTEDKRLYYLLGDDMAYEFPIAVGKSEKDRFYGVYPISRKVKWPSWRPTPSMLKKEPNLPKIVKGGKNNPLGARALYLGDSPFRIHGTNRPSSIGKAASHGCIRMHNRDVKRLYNLVELWDRVYVQ